MAFLLGVDEAGRGPLAGPVAVGVVMVAEGFDVAREFRGVADSKAISEKKRERLFELLEERQARGDLCFSVEFGSAEDIDREGIVPVIRNIVARGLEGLVRHALHHEKNIEASPRYRVLLDGALRAPDEYEQETIIGGDATVPLISLASIAAKVSRDRLMLELAKTHPEYGFERHKGYGTKLHYDMLAKHGPSALHRRTFLHLA